jgi:hypothetical protein
MHVIAAGLSKLVGLTCCNDAIKFLSKIQEPGVLPPKGGTCG